MASSCLRSRLEYPMSVARENLTCSSLLAQHLLMLNKTTIQDSFKKTLCYIAYIWLQGGRVYILNLSATFSTFYKVVA